MDSNGNIHVRRKDQGDDPTVNRRVVAVLGFYLSREQCLEQASTYYNENDNSAIIANSPYAIHSTAHKQDHNLIRTLGPNLQIVLPHQHLLCVGRSCSFVRHEYETARENRGTIAVTYRCIAGNLKVYTHTDIHKKDTEEHRIVTHTNTCKWSRATSTRHFGPFFRLGINRVKKYRLLSRVPCNSNCACGQTIMRIDESNACAPSRTVSLTLSWY